MDGQLMVSLDKSTFVLFYPFRVEHNKEVSL